MSTSAKFVTQLRTRGAPIVMASEGARDALTIRVEVPELWDVQAVVVQPSESIVAVKQRALAVLYPQASNHEDFVVKLRGWEVLDEHSTLAEVGVLDGSILLLTHRRRRAVR